MACNASLMPNLILNPYRLVRSLPDRGILKRVICCTIVVAFAVTTVLPPSFAQELQLTTKLSPTSRFETTRVASNGPSPASLTPGWMTAAAAVLALAVVACTGNTPSPQQQAQAKEAQRLMGIAKNKDAELSDRIDAMDSLYILRDPSAIPDLVEIFLDKSEPYEDNFIDPRALTALLAIGEPAKPALENLLAKLKEREKKIPLKGDPIATAAMQAQIMGLKGLITESLQTMEHSSLFIDIVKDKQAEAWKRKQAMLRLSNVNERSAIGPLKEVFLNIEEGPDIRLGAVFGLAQLNALNEIENPQAVVQFLLTRFNEAGQDNVKIIWVLERMGTHALLFLEKAAQTHPDPVTRERLQDAVRKIKPAQQQKQDSMIPANGEKRFALNPFKLMPAAILALLFFPSVGYGADGGVVTFVTGHWIISGIIGLIAAWVISRHFTLVRPALKAFTDILIALRDAKDNTEILLQLDNLEKLAVKYVQAQIFSSRGTGITPQNLKPIKEKASQGASKLEVLGMVKAIEFDPFNRKTKGIIDDILKDVAVAPVPKAQSKVEPPAAIAAPAPTPTERFISILKNPASNPQEVFEAITALAGMKTAEATPTLVDVALDKSRPFVIVPIMREGQQRKLRLPLRAAALKALADIGVTNREVIQALVELSSNNQHAKDAIENNFIRASAIAALGKLGNTFNIKLLEGIAQNDPNPDIKQAANKAIEKISKPIAPPKPISTAPVQAATASSPKAVFVAEAIGLNPNDYIITNGMGFLRQPILDAKGAWKKRTLSQAQQIQKKKSNGIKISDLLIGIVGYGFGGLMLLAGGGAIYTGDLIPPPFFLQPTPGTGYYNFIYMLDALLALVGLAIVLGAPLLGGLVIVLDKILGKLESPVHLTKNFRKIDDKPIPEDKEEKLSKQLEEKNKIILNLIGLAYANYSFPSLAPAEQQNILSLLEERASHQKTKVHSLMIALLGILAADTTETEPESAPLRQFTGRLDKLLKAPAWEWGYFKDIRKPTAEDVTRKRRSAFALLAISLFGLEDKTLEALRSKLCLNEPDLQLAELRGRLIEDVKMLIKDTTEPFQIRHVAALALGEAIETKTIDYELVEDALASLGYMWLEAKERHYDTAMLRFAIRAIVEASERQPALAAATATKTHATAHRGPVSITEQAKPLSPRIVPVTTPIPTAIPVGGTPRDSARRSG